MSGKEGPVEDDAGSAEETVATEETVAAQDAVAAEEVVASGDAAAAEESAASDAATTAEAAATEAEGAIAAVDETGLWPVERLRPLVEALVFAAGDPLTAKKIADIIEGSTIDEVKAALAELSTDYLTRGMRLIEVAGGWQMRTGAEHQRYVRKLFRERPQRLTRAATETVAIIAYKQPVTRQEIEAVRGVDSGGVIESLVERRLAKVVGRKDVPGRPLVYATTTDFLELFGLKSIRELPTLPELGSDFERMSERSGFSEGVDAAILPLEDDDGAQEARTAGVGRPAEAPDSDEAAGQDGDEAGEAGDEAGRDDRNEEGGSEETDEDRGEGSEGQSRG